MRIATRTFVLALATVAMMATGTQAAPTAAQSASATSSALLLGRPQTVWLVGDSILAGRLVGDSILAGTQGVKPPRTIRDYLAVRLPSRSVLQYARGFWTMGLDWYVPTHAGGSARPDPGAIRALLLPGDAVLLMLGSNDLGLAVPMEDFRRRYAEMLVSLSTADVILSGPGPTALICVTPIWRADALRPNRVGANLADYASAIHEVCSSHGVPVVDGLDLIGPEEETLLGDGLHPDVRGRQQLARRLASKVSPILDRFVSDFNESRSPGN